MRLIDADKLVDTLRDTVFEYGDTGGSWGSFMPDVCAIVREEPEVDPVKHGRWIVHQDGYAECSQCRKMMFIPKVFVKHPENITDRYCNMCGAKMDEVSE